MPVRTSNNNAVLPANARASDVASRAIQEILPAQQMRYQSAFRVQGFQGILYNRLYQGRKCTCQASQKELASRLDESGKAKPGVVNELLTGGMVFDVTPYGQSMPRNDPYDSVVSPAAPKNKYQGVFDVVQEEPLSLPANIDNSEPQYGDNGPLDPEFDINMLVDSFDSNHIGHTEVSCAICFGTGFVGGYSPLLSQRIVKAVNEVQLIESELDIRQSPWTASGLGFTLEIVLPYGAVALDVMRVMNGFKPVTANFKIDGQAINQVSVLAFCDGRPHTVEARFSEPLIWTHVEIQFATSSESAYFEFPRLNKSSDISLLEQTEPFQIILSPLIPSVQSEDVFTESVTGKSLIVQTVNTWNTRNKDVLGWECQVKPVQPQELYNILPRRGRIVTKPPTTRMSQDNSTGYRRT